MAFTWSCPSDARLRRRSRALVDRSPAPARARMNVGRGRRDHQGLHADNSLTDRPGGPCLLAPRRSNGSPAYPGHHRHVPSVGNGRKVAASAGRSDVAGAAMPPCDSVWAARREGEHWFVSRRCSGSRSARRTVRRGTEHSASSGHDVPCTTAAGCVVRLGTAARVSPRTHQSSSTTTGTTAPAPSK